MTQIPHTLPDGVSAAEMDALLGAFGVTQRAIPAGEPPPPPSQLVVHTLPSTVANSGRLAV